MQKRRKGRELVLSLFIPIWFCTLHLHSLVPLYVIIYPSLHRMKILGLVGLVYLEAGSSSEVSVTVYPPAGHNIQLVVNFHHRRFDRPRSA
jgi:hypothetical protein